METTRPMTPSPTLSENIRIILKDKFVHARPSTKICEYSLKYQEAIEAIMEAIRESVPLSSGMTSTDWINGFQQCREEMLRRLQ